MWKNNAHLLHSSMLIHLLQRSWKISCDEIFQHQFCHGNESFDSYLRSAYCLASSVGDLSAERQDNWHVKYCWFATESVGNKKTDARLLVTMTKVRFVFYSHKNSSRSQEKFSAYQCSPSSISETYGQFTIGWDHTACSQSTTCIIFTLWFVRNIWGKRVDWAFGYMEPRMLDNRCSTCINNIN